MLRDVLFATILSSIFRSASFGIYEHDKRSSINLREPNRSSSGIVAKRVQLHRALSKLGFSSRKLAWGAIVAGRVRVGATVVRDPLAWVDIDAQVGKRLLHPKIEQARSDKCVVFLMYSAVLTAQRIAIDGAVPRSMAPRRVWAMYKVRWYPSLPELRAAVSHIGEAGVSAAGFFERRPAGMSLGG